MCICATSLTLSSCSKDDDPIIEKPEQDPLENTRWTYNDRYSSDGNNLSISYLLSFGSNTATLAITTTINYSDGSTYTEPTVRHNYRYTYSNNLVVLNPTEPNVAYLEGTITSNIKMAIVNVSSGEQIGVFYKE